MNMFNKMSVGIKIPLLALALAFVSGTCVQAEAFIDVKVALTSMNGLETIDDIIEDMVLAAKSLKLMLYAISLVKLTP